MCDMPDIIKGLLHRYKYNCRHIAFSKASMNKICDSPKLVLRGVTFPETELLRMKQFTKVIEFLQANDENMCVNFR